MLIVGLTNASYVANFFAAHTYLNMKAIGNLIMTILIWICFDSKYIKSVQNQVIGQDLADSIATLKAQSLTIEISNPVWGAL
jgi:hypothetical protein